jgi:hypothetical protein
MIELPNILAGCAILGALATWLTLAMRYENRLTGTTKDSLAALQTAAEAVEHTQALERKIELCDKERAQEIARLSKEIIEVADRVRREVGESLKAIQTKIHDFETWSRDEFVRKKSFEAFIERWEKLADARDKNLSDRLDRIENKLDAAATRPKSR